MHFLSSCSLSDILYLIISSTFAKIKVCWVEKLDFQHGISNRKKDDGQCWNHTNFIFGLKTVNREDKILSVI